MYAVFPHARRHGNVRLLHETLTPSSDDELLAVTDRVGHRFFFFVPPASTTCGAFQDAERPPVTTTRRLRQHRPRPPRASGGRTTGPPRARPLSGGRIRHDPAVVDVNPQRDVS